MRSKVLSVLLGAALLFTLVPPPSAEAAAAAVSDGFMRTPQVTAPASALRQLPESPALPLPSPRGDGFLAAPDQAPPSYAFGVLPGLSGSPDAAAVEVGSLDELLAVTSGSVVLTADIDASGVFEGGETRIADGGALTIDGRGHALKTVGGQIFSDRKSPLTLKNLVFESSAGTQITVTQRSGEAFAGLLAGTCGDLTLDHCAVSIRADIEQAENPSAAAGGLAGLVRGDFTATDCALLYSGKLQGYLAGGFAGGVDGLLTLERCTLSVTAEVARFGGISNCGTGGVAGRVGSLDLRACRAEETLTQTDIRPAAVGGIAGHAGTVHARDALLTVTHPDYSLGNTTVSGRASGWVFGAIAGRAVPNDELTLENCSAAVSVGTIGNSGCGGLIGRIEDGGGKLRAGNCRVSGSIDYDEIGLYSVNAKSCAVGGLVGVSQVPASLSGCLSEVELASEYVCTGGLIGYAKTLRARSCVFSGALRTLTPGAESLGGIAGSIDGGSVADCLVTGSVCAETSETLNSYSITRQDSPNVGGIAGSAFGADFYNCCFAGTVSALCCIRFGGIAGRAEGSTFELCTAAPGEIGSVCARNFGGIVGQLTGGKNTLRRCAFSGEVSMEAVTGGGLKTGFLGGIIGGSASSAKTSAAGCAAEGTLTACEGSSLAIGGIAAPVGSAVVVLSGGGLLRSISDSSFRGTIDAGDSSYPLLGIGGAESIDNCFVDATLLRGREVSCIGGTQRVSDCRFGGNAEAKAVCRGITYAGKAVGCYVSGSISAEESAFGIGVSADNCRVEAEISGGSVAAGLGGGPDYSDCAFSGSVTSGSGDAFGIAQACKSVTLCTVEGSISGAATAAGICSSADSVCDCSVDADILAAGDVGRKVSGYATFLAAGIAASGAQIVNSTVSGSVRSAYTGGADKSSDVRAGGICASGGSLFGCSSAAEVSADTNNGTAYAGGLSAYRPESISACRVSGTVSAANTNRKDCYAGGWTAVSGYAGLPVSDSSTAALCSVSSPNEKAKADPRVAYGTYQEDASPILPESGKPAEEVYTIRVLGSLKPLDTTEFAPLAGAAVELHAVGHDSSSALLSGVTDENGVVTFTSDEIKGMAGAELTVVKEGYCDVSRLIFPSDGAEETVYAVMNEPGRFTVVTCRISAGKALRDREILLQKGKTALVVGSGDRAVIETTVRWNGLTDGDLWLEGTRSGAVVPLTPNGKCSADVTNLFEIGEAIVLRGRAWSSEAGEWASQEYATSLTVVEKAIRADFGTQTGGTAQELWFLDLLGVDLQLGRVDRFLTGVTFEDGVLKGSFDFSSDKGFGMQFLQQALDQGGLKLGVKGEIGTTLLPSGDWSDWSGKITFYLGRAELPDGIDKWQDSLISDTALTMTGKNPLNYSFQAFIGSVPVFIDLACNPSFSFGGGFQGNGDADTDYYGTLSVGAGVDVFGGLGGELTDDLELKAGINGKLDVTAGGPIAKEDEQWNVTIVGSVSAKAKFKAFIINPEVELDLVGFKWNSIDGYTPGGGFSSLAESNAALMANGEWTLFDPGSMNRGAGFLGSGAALMDAGDPEQVLYEDIGDFSDLALGSENDLFFTRVNPALAPQNALELCYTHFDGAAWSEPVIVSGNGTLDTIPSAFRTSVIWADGETALNADASLDDMLADTGISAAVMNGDGTFAVTRLSEAKSGYNCSPSLGGFGTKLYAAWLNKSAVTADNPGGSGGSVKLCGAVYSEGAWTLLEPVELDESVSRVVVRGSLASYRENGVLKYRSLSSGSFASPSSGPSALNWDRGDSAYVYQTESGLYLGSKVYSQWSRDEKKLSDLTAAGANAWFLSGEGLWYLGGTAADAPFLLHEGAYASLAASGRRYAALRTDDAGLTHLVTGTVNLSELTLAALSVNERGAAETGSVTLTCLALNRSASNLNTAPWLSLYEGEKLIDQKQIPALQSSGALFETQWLLPADGLPHSYTVTVSAAESGVSDATPDDNSLTVQSGVSDAGIVDASLFTERNGETRLRVVAGNTGTLTLPELTLSVFEDGREILTETFRDASDGSTGIGVGSLRSITLPVRAGALYTAEVYTAGDADELNNTETLLLYDDEETVLPGSDEIGLHIVSARTQSLTVEIQNGTEHSAELFLLPALYLEDGTLVTAGGVQCFTAESRASFTASLTLPPVEDGAYFCRVFRLDSAEGLIPLQPAAEAEVIVR